MKKFTAIIMTALLVLSLTACSSNTEIESSNPSTGESTVSSAPETSAPETSAPETSAPETSAPETSAPETSAPETSAPETSAPETSAPETSAPETSAPETSAPETSAPETSAPETSAPVDKPVEPEIEEENEISDPVELLNTAWEKFGEDERFPATGGDFSSEELIEGAGAFSIADPDALDYVTGFPAAQIGSIDSCATLMHMMNANTFTSGAFHVVSGTDIAALNSAVRDNIQARMWMCGFPEKMIVANVGEYLVCAFGKNQPIDAFVAHLTEAYPNAVIAIEEPIL